MKARDDIAILPPEHSDMQRAKPHDDSPASDGQLLSEFAGGKSEGALTQLIERYRAMVFLVGLKILHDEHAAEDVVQVTFATLARKAAELSHEGPLRGWIYGTARLVSLGMLKSRARRARRELEAASIKDAASDSWTFWEEIRPELNAALKTISTPQWDAVRLYYLNGLPQDRIASLVGCARSTVSARILGGLSRLRRALTIQA